MPRGQNNIPHQPPFSRTTATTENKAHATSTSLLDLVQLEVDPHDPPTPENPILEPNTQWIGWSVEFSKMAAGRHPGFGRTGVSPILSTRLPTSKIPP